MGRYSRYLGEAFRERLSVLEKHALGALSLREELLLMQDLLGRAAAQYEAAMQHAVAEVDLDKRMRITHFATEYLVEKLNQVRDMTIAAKRVEESNRVVDVAMVHALVAHTCTIIEDRLKERGGQLVMAGVEPEDIVMNIAEDIRTKLLTVDAVAKTQLTPEKLNKDVAKMLDSVPEVA